MSTPKFVDIENTRTSEQREVYERIEAEGFDPFEAEYFRKNHPHPIIFENEHWVLTHNAFPYSGMLLHLLIVYKPFVTSIEEITIEGWKNFHQLVQFATVHFKLESGAFFMRFGDTKGTGGTVTHLHAHIMVADRKPDERCSMYVTTS